MSNPTFPDGTSRAPGPGKFEGESFATILAWRATLEGFADESTGDVDFGGAYDLLRGPEGFPDLVKYLEPGEAINGADRSFLADHCAIILRTDSNGFVYGTWYRDLVQAETDWREIEDSINPEPED